MEYINKWFSQKLFDFQELSKTFNAMYNFQIKSSDYIQNSFKEYIKLIGVVYIKDYKNLEKKYNQLLENNNKLVNIEEESKQEIASLKETIISQKEKIESQKKTITNQKRTITNQKKTIETQKIKNKK